MRSEKVYQGIHNELHGMTTTANVIRDAWVFGILPESETCEGWTVSRIEEIYGKVSKAWEPYGHLVSQLPADLRERHKRIYDAAIRHAKSRGWEPDMENDD